MLSSHKKLDEAVFAAYGWKSDLSDEHPSSMLRRDFREAARTKFGEKQVKMAILLELNAIITCPHCEFAKQEQMPPDT
jgi:hypothetical protein